MGRVTRYVTGPLRPSTFSGDMLAFLTESGEQPINQVYPLSASPSHLDTSAIGEPQTRGVHHGIDCIVAPSGVYLGLWILRYPQRPKTSEGQSGRPGPTLIIMFFHEQPRESCHEACKVSLNLTFAMLGGGWSSGTAQHGSALGHLHLCSWLCGCFET